MNRDQMKQYVSYILSSITHLCRKGLNPKTKLRNHPGKLYHDSVVLFVRQTREIPGISAVSLTLCR